MDRHSERPHDAELPPSLRLEELKPAQDITIRLYMWRDDGWQDTGVSLDGVVNPSPFEHPSGHPSFAFMPDDPWDPNDPFSNRYPQAVTLHPFKFHDEDGVSTLCFGVTSRLDTPVDPAQ